MSIIEPILLTGDDRPGRKRRSSEVSWSLWRVYCVRGDGMSKAFSIKIMMRTTYSLRII
jgi:hypothetical protein